MIPDICCWETSHGMLWRESSGNSSQPSLLIPHKETGAGQATQGEQPSILDHQTTDPRSTSHCKSPFLLLELWEQPRGPPKLLNLIVCGEFGCRARKPKQKQVWRQMTDVQGIAPARQREMGSLGVISDVLPGANPPMENTVAEESMACQAHSNTALKYQLGKETKRDGFGLKRTHLFSRSIYLFIN